MVLMLVIQKPFSRICDGPLPKTKQGNQYIFTICDYATRYPEATPLPSIEAHRVARELLLVFSRVGVPEEVLTDQGAREVQQETTGFSLFELLYGYRMRGPLDVLRESWTDEHSPEIPVAAHVIEMRD